MKNRFIHILLSIVVFIYIIFEEIFWESIARPVYKYIHELKLLKKLEHFILKMPSYVILILFLFIFAMVEFLGIVAGALFLKGNIFIAVSLYLSKIPISAFTFWLFKISKQKLLAFVWFKKSYNFILQKIDLIKSTQIYQQIKSYTRQIKKTFKLWKIRYFPKGSFSSKIKHIYYHLKQLFKY